MDTLTAIHDELWADFLQGALRKPLFVRLGYDLVEVDVTFVSELASGRSMLFILATACTGESG